jgi:thioesterase domain-containing protein
VNFLQSMQRRPGFTSNDRLLAVTTLSFDIAGLELYLPLMCGGQVVLADRTELRDPMLLQDLIRAVKPTVMQATPATWRALIDAGWDGTGGMRILCGGESMTRELADQLLARSSEVWNMFGPTETTIWSTVQRVTAGAGAISIGQAIDNTQVYVLDAERNLVPDGVTGELYIGGEGVARGYLGRPELTAERFVRVEAAGGARLYKTGDLARWRSDGTLECLGRADNQVKIRGFRVEVEEIEAVLVQHPEVRAAAVKAWPDASGHLALAGYVVTNGHVVTNGDPDIRAFLRDKLPDYMIPSVFIRVEQLPLTPNLKVDRRKLPSPELGRERAEFVASESDDERRLAGIWESILGVQNIGAHDDFFRSGGHSLLVPKLLSRVEQAFGVRLPMSSLFEAPTIREFALLLKNPDPSVRGSVRTVPIRNNASKQSLIWVYPGPEMRGMIEHLNRPFVGVALSPPVEAALPHDFTLEQIASHLVREIRATQPDGPYNIGGWCDAGILAFEVASQLRRQGFEVDTLVLLDSLNPVTYLAMPARRRRASKLKYNLQRIAALRRNHIRDYLRERAEWARQRVRSQISAFMDSYEQKFSRASERYVPPAYAGRVLALIPERIPTFRNPLLHWGSAVSGDFQVRIVRGDHLSMFTEGASDLAASIDATIAAAEAERERCAQEDMLKRARYAAR